MAHYICTENSICLLICSNNIFCQILVKKFCYNLYSFFLCNLRNIFRWLNSKTRNIVSHKILQHNAIIATHLYYK